MKSTEKERLKIIRKTGYRLFFLLITQAYLLAILIFLYSHSFRFVKFLSGIIVIALLFICDIIIFNFCNFDALTRERK